MMKMPLYTRIILAFYGSLLFLLILSSFASATIDTDSIVLYHSNDDADVSGSTIEDSSSSSNDGTINGATTGITGVLNEAFDYDGSNDYVSVSDDNSLDLTGDKTINFWLYDSQSGGGSNEKVIFAKDTYSNGVEGMTAHDSNNLYYFRDGTNTLSFGRTIKDEWFMVTIVQDGGTTYLYTNNTLRTSGTLNYDWDNTNDLYFMSEEGSSRFMDGDMDEFLVSDEAYNSTQRNELYNGGDGFNPFYVTEYFEINAFDSSDNSSISSFNATINYTETNSSSQELYDSASSDNIATNFINGGDNSFTFDTDKYVSGTSTSDRAMLQKIGNASGYTIGMNVSARVDVSSGSHANSVYFGFGDGSGSAGSVAFSDNGYIAENYEGSSGYGTDCFLLYKQVNDVETQLGSTQCNHNLGGSFHEVLFYADNSSGTQNIILSVGGSIVFNESDSSYTPKANTTLYFGKRNSNAAVKGNMQVRDIYEILSVRTIPVSSFFETSNGTLRTNLTKDAGLTNITIKSEGYDTATYTSYNVSTNLNVSLNSSESFFEVKAFNSSNDESISSFNATINDTFYSTTDGTITTTINNDAGLFNITIQATDFYTKNYVDYNVSTNLNATLTEIPESKAENISNTRFYFNPSIDYLNLTTMTLTQYNISATNQTSEGGLFNVTLNALANYSVFMTITYTKGNINTHPVKCSNNSDITNAKLINGTTNLITGSNLTTQIYCWNDYINADDGFNFDWKINGTVT